MDLRHLRTFATVAEQGTVSKASAALRVAQPALSRQIKDLEQELGIKLFDRVRRRLVLTSEGEQLLRDCSNVLGAADSFKERSLELQRADAGVLKVAATPQTIDGVLSGFLARYRKQRPNVQIRLSEAFGSALIEKVERGETHIAISTRGAFESSAVSLEVTWLPSLEFVAAYNPASKLEKNGSMDVRDLGNHPVLLLDRNFAVRAAFDAACRIAEFKPNVFFESRTPHTLLALAEAGHGVAIVPSVMPVHRYKLRVSRLTYRGTAMKEAYGIVRDKRRSLPPAADHFCRSLVGYVREVFPISRPSAARGRSVRSG